MVIGNVEGGALETPADRSGMSVGGSLLFEMLRVCGEGVQRATPEGETLKIYLVRWRIFSIAQGIS